MLILSYIDPMSGAILAQMAIAAVIGLALRIGYGFKRLIWKPKARDESPSAPSRSAP